MKIENAENIQTLTTIIIWITFFVFAYGFAYQKQYVMLAGLFILGTALVVRAPLSFFTINQWQKNDAKIKVVFWGECFFAFGQFIFGVFAIAGSIADIATDYLTSGRFWKQVAEYPFLFIFSFGSFCSLVGISQIAANLKPEGDRFVDKLGSFKEIVEGIVFLIFGLIFIGLIVFVKLF